jgi:hypothetical protein
MLKRVNNICLHALFMFQIICLIGCTNRQTGRVWHYWNDSVLPTETTYNTNQESENNDSSITTPEKDSFIDILNRLIGSPKNSANDLKEDVPKSILAIFSALCYEEFDLDDLNNPESSYQNEDKYISFKDIIVDSENSKFSEITKGWKLLTHGSDGAGFHMRVYSKGNNLVLAIRGTDDPIDWLEHIVGMSAEINSSNWVPDNLQVYGMIPYLNNTTDNGGIRNILEEADNIYITGHSLGGYLSYFAADWFAKSNMADKLKQIVTFNGQVLNRDRQHNTLYGIKTTDYIKSKLERYVVEFDAIGDIMTSIGGDGLVEATRIKQYWDNGLVQGDYYPTDILDRHSMNNFLIYFNVIQVTHE